MSRRQVLAGGASVALVGLVGVTDTRAQYTGIMEGGGGVPFRLPMGALNYLDRNQYIHNMDIISFAEGSPMRSGEPLMSMWARGSQRLITTGNGWLDVSNPRRPKNIDLGMPMRGTISFQESTGKWIFMRTHGEPLTGAGPGQPHGRWHEEVFRRAVSFDGLRGISTYDINDPGNPKLLGEFSTGSTGSGTHHNYYDGGRYAYLDAGWSDQFRMENAQRAHGNGLMIVDLSDPANVKEVSRYHVPGQLFGEEDEYRKYWFAGDHAAWTSSHGAPSVPVRVEDGGRFGYGGFGHFGMITFDFSDIADPKPLSKLRWDSEAIGGIPYHTVFPVVDGKGQFGNIIIGIPEAIEPDCREPYKPVQVIDVSDPRNPEIIGLFRRPVPPEDAPYNDFCLSRGRFGTHNSQCFIAPGASNPNIVATTHFNAGIRITDISDPTKPREVAWFLPPRGGEIEDYHSWRRGDSETVFIEWDRNLIWLGTHAGNYCLSCPALGEPVLKPRKIERWTVPHGNRGWDA
ncbi:MAG: LVIVD repeat-containing protein [Woeseia sp.]